MNEDEYLLLSGIQHFNFCRRQWALIHIEEQWSENYLTTEGNLAHERAHNSSLTEKRGDVITARGLKIASKELGLSGECDVVEFHSDPQGVTLQKHKGLYLPMPVEYKRGKPKTDDCDRLQLCAQAMCLEEMLLCTINSGALFYVTQKRREIIDFTPELREKVRKTAAEMHELYRRKHTPKVKTGSFCKSCSLANICLPVLNTYGSAKEYVKNKIREVGDL
ncbi:MAG: CRISPR-associated protein Cas4 [Oscillospiraceae bacterium]|jgi:CRISPR-associated exonuclease Cas4|nr:CRISPR-associated protein Cas4 [Oscillospiraceae bacterium]